MPNITTRRIKGTATTPGNTLTPIFALPKLPLNGSFSLKGSVIARGPTGKVTAFSPFNSGTIVSGAVTQAGGGAQAAPCPTSPSDGGATQTFAPPGCSSAADGTGLTTALLVGSAAALGVPAEFRVTGLAATVITWSWDLTLTVHTS